MAVLFVLGMGAFLTGVCCLAIKCVVRTIGPKPEGSKPTESGAVSTSMVIPDTVPLEWVKDYRAGNGV